MGGGGGGGKRYRCGGREREIIYLSLHCHHQNDFCMKVGSDESHFNVSLIVRDKVTRQVSTDQNSRRERRDEADSNLTARPNRLS